MGVLIETTRLPIETAQVTFKILNSSKTKVGGQWEEYISLLYTQILTEMVLVSFPEAQLYKAQLQQIFHLRIEH